VPQFAPGGNQICAFKLTVLVAAGVLFGCSGVAAAAPKNYCADLKGVDTGQACQIQMSDPGYNVNISFPTDYPDQKSVADYITQTRDGFLNVAKSPAPRDMPYELDITATNYGSAIPPRGTEAVVLKTYQNVGGAHPETLYKAFNWDQTYRKPIAYNTAGDDKLTPLWRVDDPLKVVFPIVQSELQKQTGQPVAIAPSAGYNPMNYQEFAVTNDAVIFLLQPGGAAARSGGRHPGIGPALRDRPDAGVTQSDRPARRRGRSTRRVPSRRAYPPDRSPVRGRRPRSRQPQDPRSETSDSRAR